MKFINNQIILFVIRLVAIFTLLNTNTLLLAAIETNQKNELHGDTTNAKESCIAEQQWWLPNENKAISKSDLLRQVSTKRVVLLGEHHNNEAHHRWHLQTIQSLYSIKKDLVLGFEMFPRRLQPILDQWVNGKLTEKEFVEKLDWSSFWSFDISLYMPLFKYAKSNHLPMRALNVDRALMEKVRKNGWKAIPENEKEGLSDPAKPSVDYLNLLAASFLRHHPPLSPQNNKQAAIGFKKEGEKFHLFVQGQLLWDRAIAEGVASATSTSDAPLFIGIMGSWHIIDRLGVPHQLTSLGISDAAILVPWDDHLECKLITPTFADAIYGAQLH
ncbi:MAG: ChaN family lipoprotein [Gammaproteobacteria bacterium]|nr:ChaN family lipoprotein [Gammaproteobacteria bacterium]